MSKECSVTVFKYRFTPGWVISLVFLSSLALLLRLGFWQIQRAGEKQQMLSAHSHLQQQPFSLWQAGDTLPEQYKRIKLKGRFLETAFYLDNQHYQHQFGYHLLSPFLLSNSHQIIMVDRGWLSGGGSRYQLPAVSTVTLEKIIHGSVYYPSSGLVLGQPFEKRSDKQILVEQIDSKIFANILQKSVYPFIIRLDSKDADGLVGDWPVVSMPPERHYAYAVQWFGLASVLCILFIALNVKKKDETVCK